MQRAATNRAVDPKRYFESVQADGVAEERVGGSPEEDNAPSSSD